LVSCSDLSIIFITQNYPSKTELGPGVLFRDPIALVSIAKTPWQTGPSAAQHRKGPPALTAWLPTAVRYYV